MKNKTFNVTFNKASESSDLFTFTASNESVDRDGDVILVDGWQLDRFEKNPVILFGHDSSKPPVGKAVAIRRVTDDENKRLEIDVEFADTEFAKEIKSLVEGGFLNAVSVGFRIHDIKEPTVEQREALGMPPFGLLISKAEMLETSIVPIPANSEALRRAVDDGLVTSKAANYLSDTKSNNGDREVAVELWKLLEETKCLVSEVKEQLNVLSKDGSVGDLAMPEDTPVTDTSVYGGLLDKAWSKLDNLTDNNKESE